MKLIGKILIALTILVGALSIAPSPAAASGGMEWDFVDQFGKHHDVWCGWVGESDRGFTSTTGAWWSNVESVGCRLGSDNGHGGIGTDEWKIVHAVKITSVNPNVAPWTSFPQVVGFGASSYRIGTLQGWPAYYVARIDTLVAICHTPIQAPPSPCTFPVVVA